MSPVSIPVMWISVEGLTSQMYMWIGTWLPHLPFTFLTLNQGNCPQTPQESHNQHLLLGACAGITMVLSNYLTIFSCWLRSHQNKHSRLDLDAEANQKKYLVSGIPTVSLNCRSVGRRTMTRPRPSFLRSSKYTVYV